MTDINAKVDYDVWHGSLEVDHLADTPWHRLVKSHLSAEADLAGRRVLEIGCGRGGFACWLATVPNGPAKIVAADFAITAVAKGQQFAAEKGLSGIQWEVGDIQALAHPDNIFDTIISCETIEHVTDPGKALRELARVLKPGGRLFVTTPNYLGSMGLYRIYRRLIGRPYTEEGQPINNVMLLPMTTQLVKKAGLKLKCVDGVGQYLPFPGRPPIEISMFDTPRALMKWFALHSLTIAEKSA